MSEIFNPDPNSGHDTLPAESYPSANALGRNLVDALMELCLLKGYVKHDGPLLKNTGGELSEGVAEALCTLQEAFNF